MVKFFACLLLLANGMFFAWHQGHLQMFGFAPAKTSEPERLAQQINPENLRVIKPEEAKRLEVAANKPPECYISSPIDAAKLQALRATLPGLVGTSPWQIETLAEPARWIAYMGKYANPEAVARKKIELKELNVATEAVRDPDLEPGISLGGGPLRADAQRKLDEAVKKGVRTGKVLEEKAASASQRLRLSAVDDALRAKWPDIKSAGGFAQFQTCKSLG